MMNSKKASFIQENLPRIILAVAVLIFLICLFGLLVLPNMENYTKKETCRESLMMSERLKAAGSGSGFVDEADNTASLNCETSYPPAFKDQTDKAIEKDVADQMVDCWNTYLQGKKEIFDTKDNTYCVVCSRLEFDKKTDVKGFASFLAANNVDGTGHTYLEYLQGVNVVNYFTSYYPNSELAKYDTLSTKEPLAVLFVMDKNAYPDATVVEATKPESTLAGTVGGGAVLMTGVAVIAIIAGAPVSIPVLAAVGIVGTVAGGAGGYFVGSTRTADWNAIIMLWPYDRLRDLNKCTYIEGKSGKLQIMDEGVNSTGGNN